MRGINGRSNRCHSTHWVFHSGINGLCNNGGNRINDLFHDGVHDLCGDKVANLPDGIRYALVVIYNVVCGPIPAAALSGAARYARSPAEVGATQGLVVQITQCGIFFGPPITAAVVTAAGSWSAALWVLLTASTIGFITSIFIYRAEKRMFAPAA